jgi:Zinc finger, C2H2 type
MNIAQFFCTICNKRFDRKYNLIRHESSNTCYKNNDIKDINNNYELQCGICKKMFPKKYNLHRHLLSNRGDCYKMRSGKYKLTINDNQLINNIQNQTINNITNTNINNITNNNINNINIQPIVILARPGEETISHITKDVMLELLNIESFPKMCTELMRLLYFNKEVPENRNWTIVYPKNKNAGVEYNHASGKFERKKTYNIIDDKFSNMISLLFDLVQEISNEDLLNNNLSKRQKININKYGMHFGQLDISKTSKEVYESIHSFAFNSRKDQMKEWGDSGHKGNHLSLKF